ncbi:hypothetical protein IKA92_03390 [bacterium]|nr:hypothetical protein [bacterium]
MNISFGKIIPVKVYIDGKVSNNQDDIGVATNILCANLRRQKHYQNTDLTEQQRRMFNAVVSDYVLPRCDSDYKPNVDTPSNVVPLNIFNPKTGKKDRYLVTGNHIPVVREIQNQFGRDKKIHGDHDKAYRDMQYKLNELKDSRSATLGKTLCVDAKSNPNAKLEKERYTISLIDFIG